MIELSFYFKLVCFDKLMFSLVLLTVERTQGEAENYYCIRDLLWQIITHKIRLHTKH